MRLALSSSSLSRVDEALRAIAFRIPRGVGEIDVLEVLRVVFRKFLGSDVDVDRKTAMKFVSLTIAYLEQARRVFAGEFELDEREEAVLEAVLAHSEREGN